MQYIFFSYQIPNPMFSFESYEKYCNLDLEDLSDRDLGFEKRRVETALVSIDDNMKNWILPASGGTMTREQWLTKRLLEIRHLEDERKGVKQGRARL